MKKFIQNHPFQSVFQQTDENAIKILFGKTEF